VRKWGWTVAGWWVAVCPLAAQRGSVGPELGIGEYRESASSLRYRGVGPGVAGTVTYHRVTGDMVLASIRMSPTGGSGATESFRATLIDAWLRWNALDYLGLEVGVTKRSAHAELAAQSVGAVRIGVRTAPTDWAASSAWAERLVTPTSRPR